MNMILLPDARRRLLLTAGGGLFLAGLWRLQPAIADEVLDIAMAGAQGGASVWFRPRAVLINRGQTVRWTNHETGNVHTCTAYHPANGGKPQRIPNGAQPWDSDYLMPGQSFSVKFDTPGAYDYFCQPHEHAGMVGRIIVVAPDAEADALRRVSMSLLPPAAVQSFVPIPEILRKRLID